MARSSKALTYPELASAPLSETLKFELMTLIREKLLQSQLTQNELGLQLGITQSRISNLMRYRLQDFSLDFLVDLARQLGQTVSLGVAEGGSTGSLGSLCCSPRDR